MGEIKKYARLNKIMKIWKDKKLIGKYGKIQDIVKKELSCSAHDWDHVMRVYNMTLHLAKYEKKIDLDILKTATLLHDIARAREDNDKTGKTDHSIESAKMSVGILKKLGYSEEKIDKIIHCILSHRYKTNNEPETIEAKILFDADKLDSMGAIVILRSGMWMGRHGCQIFPKIELNKYAKFNLMGGKLTGRIKNASLHNIFYEHEIKGKKLVKKMHTKEAKRIAKNRFEFMDKFLDRVEKEAEGIL
jgi:uncharacterized protein